MREIVKGGVLPTKWVVKKSNNKVVIKAECSSVEDGILPESGAVTLRQGSAHH
jgi:hypothetical protein